MISKFSQLEQDFPANMANDAVVGPSVSMEFVFVLTKVFNSIPNVSASILYFVGFLTNLL